MYRKWYLESVIERCFNEVTFTVECVYVHSGPDQSCYRLPLARSGPVQSLIYHELRLQ